MNKSLLTLLKDNWIIIVVIGQFLFTVYTLQNGFTDHENRISELELTKVTNALNISEINSRLASIETSLVFIKEALK
tara:strand:+ start:123 stop:353 length:231 start_codon:yes stop_codon:yes gene_type:complete